MMQNHDYELDALRREHMMQKAQERQMADQFTQSNRTTSNRGVVSPTLAGMGRVLSTIGNGLQQRYGDLSSNTNSAPFQTETA